MENLLLEKEKEVSRREFWFRALGVFLLLMAAVEFAGAALLLPAYLSAAAATAAAGAKKSLAPKLEIKDRAVFKILADMKVKIAQLTPSARVSFEDTTKLFLKHLAVGIALEDFTVVFDEPDLVSVSLRGRAKTREALLSFSQALEKEALVSDVKVPLSNLAASRNIDFPATFFIHNNLPQQ